LALVIVFGSVALLAVSMAVPTIYKFPDALVGILGAVLGFYFGKNGSSAEGGAVAAVAAANADARDAIKQASDAKAESQDAQAQTVAANQALQSAKAQHDALANDRLDTITGHLQDAVNVGQTLSQVLPGRFGQTVATATQVVSNTLTTVSDLRKGDLAGAIQQATRIVDQTAPNLPVVNVLAKAAQAIAPVLGSSIPPLALLTTLVSIGSKLGSVAYAHWIARIMDLPYTPEQFSPKLFDSNAAVSVVTQVPAVLRAFRPQLAAGDREVALEVVQLALLGDSGEALTRRYPQAFAGVAQPQIEAAVRDLQKAALDMVMTTAKTLESAKKHPETEFSNAAALLSRTNTAAAA
jgi:hypothetical protein